MDAKRQNLIFEASDDQGQSLLEFLLMLPILLSFALILYRANSAIQVSIVNQQYSRAQALFLTFNSPYYPSILNASGATLRADMLQQKDNQMILGISGNVIGQSADGTYSPDAPTQMVSGFGQVKSQADAQGTEPVLRANVRIRNTVTLCTAPFSSDNTLQPITINTSLCGGTMNYE